ncbi:MAG: hypothetical protein U0936_25845 [Planctomycetaceae bacterium]
MMTLRTHLMLSTALGMVACLSLAATVVADDKLGNADAKHHEHDAAKMEKEIAESLAELSAADRKLAQGQRFCTMMEYSRLGAMGTPVKVMVDGKPVFVCCESCVEEAVKGGDDTLAKAKALTESSAVLAKLSKEDRAAAEAQKYCAIQTKGLLGSMGAPIKLDLNGTPVFLCCKGCTGKAKANPKATLAKVEELKKAGEHDEHGDHEHGDHWLANKAAKKK